MRIRMVANRWIPWLLLLLVLSLAGCGSLAPTAEPPAGMPDERAPGDAQVSPLAQAQLSPLPAPALGPLDLVILHTNDNWGETEPCG